MEDVSLLERCPHFRGLLYIGFVEVGTSRHFPIREVSTFHIQASMDLGPEDTCMSLLFCVHKSTNKNVHL